MSLKIGQRIATKKYGEFTIIEIRSYNDIDVQFDDGTVVTRQAKEVKRGVVANYNKPEVCGVGFRGYGKYSAKENGKNTPAYEVWRGILRRCYGVVDKNHAIQYFGTTVSEEWLNFQNFAEWFYSQPNWDKGYHCDKDFMSDGIKIYSKETCFLCPPELNSLFTGAGKACRGANPKGVHFCSLKKKFIAQYHNGGTQQEYLGAFNSAKDAFVAYKVAKERRIKEVAEKYKNEIPEVVYNKLINFIVTEDQ